MTPNNLVPTGTLDVDILLNLLLIPLRCHHRLIFLNNLRLMACLLYKEKLHYSWCFNRILINFNILYCILNFEILNFNLFDFLLCLIDVFNIFNDYVFFPVHFNWTNLPTAISLHLQRTPKHIHLNLISSKTKIQKRLIR
jgi:hypothetical protein